ncbi:hypothetical protein RHMOL_Rhmol04G0315100 [Rhododendron molle]|uniref:Uncharacterized protein n=1 Tax=Rhododendron molle TaxID=49168 RepID=A0ACC0P6H5_RHOML|nr:hypothetical protein RHMOL_Rhmol04G0315100 [Rhododendron molle]
MHALLKLLCTIAVETRDYYQNMGPNMYRAAMRDRIEELNQYSADQFALQLTPNSNTLLHVAAEFGSYYCVPAILSKCPSLLRLANTDGDTPIHVAVARMNSRVVELLVNFAKSEGGGAAAVREMLRARNHDGDTPLHLAARYGISGAILEILSAEEDPGLDHGRNKAGETPLYLLVERGYDVAVLSHMLKTCIPPEYYGGPSGRTALHAAVIRRKGLSENSGDRKYLDEFLNALIEWKKDLIKELDAYGQTPLHYAADNGDVEAWRRIEPRNGGGRTPIMVTATVSAISGEYFTRGSTIHSKRPGSTESGSSRRGSAYAGGDDAKVGGSVVNEGEDGSAGGEGGGDGVVGGGMDGGAGEEGSGMIEVEHLVAQHVGVGVENGELVNEVLGHDDGLGYGNANFAGAPTLEILAVQQKPIDPATAAQSLSFDGEIDAALRHLRAVDPLLLSPIISLHLLSPPSTPPPTPLSSPSPNPSSTSSSPTRPTPPSTPASSPFVAVKTALLGYRSSPNPAPASPDRRIGSESELLAQWPAEAQHILSTSSPSPPLSLSELELGTGGIGRKYWLLQKKFLRGLDEKDQGGKGKMNSKEQKERPEKGKQNAGEDHKVKMVDQRHSETLMIVTTLIREKEKQKAAEDMGKMADTHMIVATLISTITFAAGFTIPGGYHGDQGPNIGMAILVREAAFKAFVISNTIALICSTSSVFLYVSASLFNIAGHEGERRARHYEIAFWLILTAMLAMMLAFSTGAYAFLAHSLGLAISLVLLPAPPLLFMLSKSKGILRRK